MKKNTHRPGLTKSANLPACTDRGRKKTTEDNSGRPDWMAGDRKKAQAFVMEHLGPLLLDLRINVALAGRRDDANAYSKQVGVQKLNFCGDTARRPVGDALYRARRCKPQYLSETGWTTVMGNDFWISHAAIKHHV
jgi:hypothetical protein